MAEAIDVLGRPSLAVSDGQVAVAYYEQGRIRENLGKVPAGSDLQKRYLATLEKQVVTFDAHRLGVAKLGERALGSRPPVRRNQKIRIGARTQGRVRVVAVRERGPLEQQRRGAG